MQPIQVDQPIDMMGSIEEDMEEIEEPVAEDEGQTKRALYLNCFICLRPDGEMLTPCGCGRRKPVHFQCIKDSILRNQSMICRTCQLPFEGLYPVYNAKRIIRFLRRRVSPLMSKLMMPLLAISLIKIQNFYRFKHFWHLFLGYLTIVLLFGIFYTIKGIFHIKRYNRYNHDIVDVEEDSESGEDPAAKIADN